jgi:hypothetical protein
MLTLCIPNPALTCTGTLTVVFSGNTALAGAVKLPSLPTSLRLCETPPDGPLVRVSFTEYVLATPGF